MEDAMGSRFLRRHVPGFAGSWSKRRHVPGFASAWSKLGRWLGIAALACEVVGTSIGCAQQRDPINRVQAFALSKHFFVGPSLSDSSDDPEFYMGRRVVDEPYGVGQGYFMIQPIGGLSRVKWEIQENVLVARLTYERIQNSDHHGSQSTNNGQVVAEFKISSHFDIKNDYNPQTGEQLNLVVENTTDRPWYQREYFRVDWSQNLVTDAYDFDPFAIGAALEGVQFDPLAYEYQDPSDPNAPVFSDAEGYFDVTNKVFARPQQVDTPYGRYPLCWFYGQYPATTCDPAEVTVRLSFKKVVDTDFEPEDWDGNKAQAFGWFTADRFGYDKNYGVLDQGWHRFASKYNIWQRSHIDGTQCAVDAWRDAKGNVQNYKVDGNQKVVLDSTTGLPTPDPNGLPFTKSVLGQDVHRDLDHDGTEDECQFRGIGPDGSPGVVSPGSRCDEFSKKCDIPVWRRTTKTIPFYFGPKAPADLFPTTAQALNQWNIAVKRATQLSRKVEATRVGLDIHQNDPTFFTEEAALLADQKSAKPTVPDIFVLCHNPVAVGDSPACGATGLRVRLGDIRYHVVDVIPTPQRPEYWGVEADFDDPLTGEKVQGSINEWGDTLDNATQRTEDLLRWVNGEITNSQIADGTYLQQWAAADKLGAARHSPNVLSSQEIKARLNSIDKSSAALNGLPAGQKLPPVVAAKIAAQNLAQALGPSIDAKIEATRQTLLGSRWEAQLVTPDMLQAAGFNPQQPFAGDPATLAAASPLRGLNPKLADWGRDILNKALVFKHNCVLQDGPEPDSLVGLARQAAALFPVPSATAPNYAALKYDRDQKLHQWIRGQFHLSVIAHEMGHSMGLRHNFTGSFDSLNYHTEYWQLRTRNGAEHYCGYDPNNSAAALDATTPHTNGADCVGPRWVDPVTDQETNGLVWKWGNTTVMDYPGDQSQDMNDIGSYDKAAMRFGYGGLVDVEKKKTVNTQAGADYLVALDGFGGIWGNSIGSNHYSMYADKYGVLGTCTARPGWNGDPMDPLAKQCSGPDLDFVATRDMRTVDKFGAAITAIRPELVAHFAVDSQNRVRHPYMYGSDEFADYGNTPVYRFDAGADAYEQMQFFISTYENRYIFNNFRRDQVMFNTEDVVRAVQYRYWDKIQGISKALALGVELLTQPGQPDPTTQPGNLMPMALGSADGLSMFVRAMTRPAPGAYVPNPPASAASPNGPPNAWGGAWQLGGAGSFTTPATTVNVALGDGSGRFVHNDYDYTQGYWWSDYQKQVGSYYEKVWAPMYLMEAYNRFISNSEDDYVDGRYKNLNYASLYPNQVRRIFSNLMATQSATQVMGQGTVAQIFTVAPYALPATGSNAANPITDVQYLPWHLYSAADPSTTQLQYPANAVLLDPLVGWETQFPALIDLFWFGPTTLNMDLIDQMRIFSPGDAASLSIPIDQEVRYRDPLTGIEYVAKNYGTEVVNPNMGFQVAKTIGARMLQHANFLAQKAYQLVGAPGPGGELTYVTDGQGNAVPVAGQDAQDSATILKNYASNIDTVRQLTLFFGYGPLH
jgi:hypothetical protein